MFKKLLSVALSIAMLCSFGILTYAETPTDDTNNNQGLYISTATVPSSATSYAKQIFAQFTIEDMLYLDFSNDEALQMRLAPGFECTPDGIENPNSCYYFPILLGEKIVALLTVTNIGGSYTYQIGKDPVAEALNGVSVSEEHPAEIVVSADAYYSVDNVNGVETLWVNPEASGENVESQKSAIVSQYATRTLLKNNKSVVKIGELTTYDGSIKQSNNTRTAYMGKQRLVPQVANYTNDAGNGVCWAACTGALIEYYLEGANSDATSAEYYRDDIASQQDTGGITDAKDYIDTYTGILCSTTGSKLTWTNVKNEILTRDAPCYTRWEQSGSTTGHAMVLSGYRYDQDNPNNTSLYGIYVMDPNKSAKQLIAYNGTYTINSKAFTWTNTLKKG